MEDEGIAPNTYGTADPVGMGRKLRQYTIFQYSEQAPTFFPYRLDQLYAFGAIPSSSI